MTGNLHCHQKFMTQRVELCDLPHLWRLKLLLWDLQSLSPKPMLISKKINQSFHTQTKITLSKQRLLLLLFLCSTERKVLFSRLSRFTCKQHKSQWKGWILDRFLDKDPYFAIASSHTDTQLCDCLWHSTFGGGKSSSANLCASDVFKNSVFMSYPDLKECKQVSVNQRKKDTKPEFTLNFESLTNKKLIDL